MRRSLALVLLMALFGVLPQVRAPHALAPFVKTQARLHRRRCDRTQNVAVAVDADRSSTPPRQARAVVLRPPVAWLDRPLPVRPDVAPLPPRRTFAPPGFVYLRV